MNVAPYPWHSLEAFAEHEPASLRALRAWACALDVAGLEEHLSTLLRVGVSLKRTRVERPAADGLGERVWLQVGTVTVYIDAEPSLVGRAVSLFLGVQHRALPSSRDVHVAWVGLLSTVLRRFFATPVVERPRSEPVGAEVVVDVRVGRDVFALRVGADVMSLGRPAPLSWSTMPLSVPLVWFEAAVELSCAKALQSGDVVVFEKEFARPCELFFAAPRGETRLRATLSETGVLMLAPESAVTVSPPEQLLSELEIPVRIEVATVTLPAREWATLAPGDIIATDVRLGQDVSLRAGGGIFARGQLCNVDGRIGVRITECIEPARP